jgi:curved DNA-binding protein CbpA
MNEADFYKILNVSPSASAEKIRSAHRRLVKRYHPDLYSTDGDKARANEQLRQINEAYRVLSNPERRREYDKRHFQQTTAAHTAAGTKTSPTSKSPRPSRPTAPTCFRCTMQSARARIIRVVNETRSVNWKRFVKHWNEPASLKWAGGMVGMIMLAMLAHTTCFPTRDWILLEKTEIRPSHNSSRQISTGRNWDLVGRYSSRSRCTKSLKEMVRIDEQAGSKLMSNTDDGTTASTVYTKSEIALAEDLFNAKLKQLRPETVDQQSIREEARQQAKEYVSKNGMPQRVRNYQCSEAETETWLRGLLKRTGLID